MSENYKYGFVTDIENEAFEKGLNEDIIRRASALRKEPQFMLDFRLKAYEKLQTMEQPNWGELNFAPVDLQDIVYYSAPKTKKSHEKIEDVDPELLATFEKLGIPLDEQKRLANVA
ncbi:MAG: Fe-S cluster assembly protein SufB, partial [Fibrobacter sp.]|nr:Fe-S cluster assembly protein SufB [Fibrobacter sp.]MDY5723940.1 Fe-S cluster assembly protein SufB [Fibrobacter sp.]